MGKLPQPIARQLHALPDVTRDVIAQRMRSVKLPEVYRALVDQVKATEDLLEIDYFSDAAEALATYAKIHRDGQLLAQARRMKLWAAWSAGRAAEKLRPTTVGRKKGQREMGGAPGAKSLLMEHGLDINAAARALRISRIAESEMERYLEAEDVPGLNRLARAGTGRALHRGSDPYGDAATRLLSCASAGGYTGNIGSHASFCRTTDPDSAAKLTPTEARRARELLREIQEWHDRFEQLLPKDL